MKKLSKMLLPKKNIDIFTRDFYFKNNIVSFTVDLLHFCRRGAVIIEGNRIDDPQFKSWTRLFSF